MSEYHLTEEDVLILRDLVGWYRTRNKTVTPNRAATQIVHGKAAADIEQGSSGDVVLYHIADTKGGETAGDTIQAYARASSVDADAWVHVTPVGNGWEILGGGGSEDEDDEDAYLMSAFMVVVGGVPDTGTLTFSAQCQEGGPETLRYGEFEIDIVTDTATSMLAKIHEALEFVTTDEKAQVKGVGGGPLKHNAFTFASRLESFALTIIAADLTVAPGGWPNYARVFRGIIADFDDTEIDP